MPDDDLPEDWLDWVEFFEIELPVLEQNRPQVRSLMNKWRAITSYFKQNPDDSEETIRKGLEACGRFGIDRLSKPLRFVFVLKSLELQVSGEATEVETIAAALAREYERLQAFRLLGEKRAKYRNLTARG